MLNILSILGLIWSIIIIGYFCYSAIFIKRKIAARLSSVNVNPSFFPIIIYSILFLQTIAWTGQLRYPTEYKQLEAKENLESIANSQIAYYKINGIYAGKKESDDTFKQINWQSPRRLTEYSYYCSDDTITGRSLEGRPLKVDKNWPYSLRPQTTNDGFVCFAIGNIDKDDSLDVWTIDNNKNLINLFDDKELGNSLFSILWEKCRIFLVKLLPLWPPLLVILIWSIYREEKRFKKAISD